MTFPSKKAAALTAGVSLALAVAGLAPTRSRAAPNPKSDSEVLVLANEANVAQAMLIEAEEKLKLDRAELDLAKRALEEHKIVAPFDGIVIERLKGPGESVRQNDAVVKLGNLNKLRAYAFVPLEHSFRVKE